MGAWGVGVYENDTACDWVYKLEESSDLSCVEEAISAVFEQKNIDAYCGYEALAAIDTIARLTGDYGVGKSYAKESNSWVMVNPQDVPLSLLEKAKKIIPLLISVQSELYENWSKTDDFDSWKHEVQSLLERLNS